MTQTQRSFLALVGAVLIVTGCGDDPNAPGTDPAILSTSDAEAIADQAAAAVLAAIEAGFPANPGPATTSSIPVDFTRDHTHDCPAGGTMTASVTVSGDMTHGPSDLTIEGSTVFSGCMHGGGERSITLDGQLVHSGTIAVTDMGREASFTMSGELSWTVQPDDDGSCTIDLSVTFADGSRGVSGTVCEREVGITS